MVGTVNPDFIEFLLAIIEPEHKHVPSISLGL